MGMAARVPCRYSSTDSVWISYIVVKVGEQTISLNTPNFAQVLGQAITEPGYQTRDKVLGLTVLVLYVTLVHAPIVTHS